MKVSVLVLSVVLGAGCSLVNTKTGGSLGGAPRSSGADDDAIVTMPDVFGMTRPDAEAALRRAGITAKLEDGSSGALCGSVVDGKVVEVGRVCQQSPAAGHETRAELPVSVLIQRENPWHGDLSYGGHWVLLPDLVGMSLDHARSKLAGLGFTAQDRLKVAYVDDGECKPNIVCRTIPAALERAVTSSGGLLYVGRPPEPPPQPATPSSPTSPSTPATDGTPGAPSAAPAAPPKPSLSDLF